MDVEDRAQKEIEREREGAAAYRMPEGPKPKGSCHYCDRPLKDDRRWCDANCRNDWQDEQ